MNKTTWKTWKRPFETPKKCLKITFPYLLVKVFLCQNIGIINNVLCKMLAARLDKRLLSGRDYCVGIENHAVQGVELKGVVRYQSRLFGNQWSRLYLGSCKFELSIVNMRYRSFTLLPRWDLYYCLSRRIAEMYPNSVFEIARKQRYIRFFGTEIFLVSEFTTFLVFYSLVTGFTSHLTAKSWSNQYCSTIGQFNDNRYSDALTV